ncbi:MAG: hypothetical protein B7Z13_13655 [Caulobacterales bacterium 32-67-6]|nr:MAG: hypothetical protein B7Z13_13655 [Caulobacterales bacterium 32-67-6]
MPDGVDGVVAFTHQGGCGGSSLSSDVTLLQRTLAGYARHPNFHSILIVGLGCEANQIPAWLANEGLEAGPTLRALTIQEAGGTARAIEAGIEIVRELAAEAAKVERQPVSASHLTVGLQCGGSDGWSGVTDFLDETVAVMIGFGRTPVEDPQGIYAGQTWAEPDLDEAAAALRALRAAPERRAQMAAAGRARVAERLSPQAWFTTLPDAVKAAAMRATQGR